MSDLRKSVLNRNQSGSKLRGSSHHNFTPLTWSEYFETEEKIETDSGTFNVYRKGNTGPLLVCLHGGGYSALTWALLAVEIFSNVECEVVAIDLRGHGSTTTKDDDNLALETLANDVFEVVMNICKESDRNIILIGHSMGGAVAVAAASLIPTAGLCVIDVVEGTALEALSSMQSILRNRPSKFDTVEAAIQWCYKSGQTRNLEAARISMPGQIKEIKVTDQCTQKPSQPFVIEEAEEDEIAEDGKFQKPPLPDLPGERKENNVNKSNQFVWRIDLRKTEKFWTGWFKGLSQKFLELSMPKILLLANIHGLDTALTVGQMQGKFQMQVLSKSGHAIHEDQPNTVAEIISTFLIKHKLANAKSNFVVVPSFVI